MKKARYSVEKKSIAHKTFRGTIIIVLVGILAKFASFISEAILAAYLGTTCQSDAYYMIASIQTTIYPMMSIGIWKVFMPLYKSHLAKGELATADSLTNKSLTFFTAISSGVTVLLMVFAPAVVSVVAPGFHDETRTLCIKLVRISAPMYIFIIASAVYASMLQCHEKFLGSQIREVASHIPTIIAAIFFYHRFGIEVMAVALVVAGLVRLLIELPFVDWGYRYRPDFRFKTQEFELMLKRLPSALISAGVAQLNALIDKAMASTLPVGTISGLNYGHKLMNVFSGLLSSAVATALYPQMIELIAQDKKEELRKLLATILNIFSLLMFPITLACILFRTELVAVVFQRGAFNASSTALTANVFALYCIGLFFVASNTLLSNVFYGYGNTRIPMQISVANLVINVALNLAFIRLWGVNGLALATSLSAIIAFFMRMKAAEQYVKLNHTALLMTALKITAAAVIACGLPRLVFWMYPANPFLTLLVSALIGVFIYTLLIKLFRIDEFNILLTLFTKKLGKRIS